MLFKKKKEKFVCPADGVVIDISEVSDPVFSQKMMGDGFAIIAKNGKVYAPISGEVCTLFPTKHAIGIKNKEGLEILIHCGLDTVELDGKGFHCLVKQNEKVKQNDLLLEMDLEVMKAYSKCSDIMVVFTSKESIELLKQNKYVSHGDEIILLNK